MSVNVDFKPFRWPGWTPFGMSVEKRVKVEEFIRRWTSGSGYDKELDVCSIEGFGCVVLTDCKPLGYNTDSKVLKYYNPLSGEYVVGKEINKKVKSIEFIYQTLLGKPHCVQLLGSADKEEGERIFFEPLYVRDLRQELKLRILTSLEKIEAVFQVAMGVKGIHESTGKITNSDYGTEKAIYLAHKDLKFSNIFVRYDAKGIRCDVGDYDCIPDLGTLSGTLGFEPPEYGSAPSAEKELIEYNFKWDQKTDLWRLGIVFAGILSNGTAPFNFFKELSKIKEKKDRLSFVANLRQEVVDSELDRLKGTTEEVLKPVWEMVKNDLMRIDPEKRTTIHAIVKTIGDIKVNATLRLQELSLENSPYMWPIGSPFVWTTEQRLDIESQITKYMASWKPKNGALFSFGQVVESSPTHIINHEIIYNNKDCFFKFYTKTGSSDRYYSLVERKYYESTGYTSFNDAKCIISQISGKTNIMRSVVVGGKDDIILKRSYRVNLYNILEDHKLNTAAKKIDAMVQICNGVKHFHEQKFVNKLNNVIFSLSHRLLNLKSVGVRLDGEKFRFDVGAYFHSLILNNQFDNALPEVSALPPDTDWANYIHIHGTEIDMWQLGILFTSVLRNDPKPLSVLPDCFNPDLKHDSTTFNQVDIYMAISDEIGAIPVGPDMGALTMSWHKVRHLLQINPKRRWNIEEFLKGITEIL